MLKSPVFVTLCGCLIFSTLPAAAYVPAKAYAGPFSQEAGSGRKKVLSRQMQKFVDSYIKENDEELARIRERSVQPFMIIDSVMDHYELPEDLRYLAVIESELRATAVSRVGAKGPWQLMAETARDLGLKVGRRSDERTNYYKSTGAAALYLRDLHREFKDWLLVLAAYNAGPVPVYRAMRLSGSRNFWALEQYLPRETRQHVRRFIATAYYFTISGPVIDPVVDPVEPMRNPVAPVGNLVQPLRNSEQSVWDLAFTFGNQVGPVGDAVLGRGGQDRAGVIDNYFFINKNRNLSVFQPCFALKPQAPAAADVRPFSGLTFLT